MQDDIEERVDLPEIRELSTQSRRAEGRVPRLPQMPGVSVDKFFMSNAREIEAEEYSYAVGIAYEEKRRRDLIMRAKARAAARLAHAIAESRIS